MTADSDTSTRPRCYTFVRFEDWLVAAGRLEQDGDYIYFKTSGRIDVPTVKQTLAVQYPDRDNFRVQDHGSVIGVRVVGPASKVQERLWQPVR